MLVAAPVLVFMPTSWRASPRTRSMFSPGRASEPTARIQTRSGFRSMPLVWWNCTSTASVDATVEFGTTRPVIASTTPSTTLRTRLRVRRLNGGAHATLPRFTS